jgi:acyl-CoA thioester hydrolase
MMQTSLPSDLRSRASFRHWTRVTLRYSDQDALGHVNNGAIPMCLEQARVETIYPVMQARGGAGLELVLARTVIDYLKELTWPGTVEIGTRIARIGSKSLATEHGVFMAGAEACCGTAECVLVFFDRATRSSILPPASVHRAISELAR